MNKLEEVKLYTLKSVLDVEHKTESDEIGASMAFRAFKNNGISFVMAQHHLLKGSLVDSNGAIWQKSQTSVSDVECLKKEWE